MTIYNLFQYYFLAYYCKHSLKSCFIWKAPLWITKTCQLQSNATQLLLSLPLAFFSQKSLSHLSYCTVWSESRTPSLCVCCAVAAQQRRLQVSWRQLWNAEGWKALASLNKSISWPLNYASSTLQIDIILSQRTKEIKGNGVSVKTGGYCFIKTVSSFKEEAHLETIKTGTLFCSSLPKISSIFAFSLCQCLNVFMSNIWWVTLAVN